MLLPFVVALSLTTSATCRFGGGAPEAVTGFSAARAWTLGYADGNRIPLIADLVGNGNSALVSINPEGNGSIDVDLGLTGLKASGGFGALGDFGKSCQAGAAGTLPGARQASIFGLFGKSITLASNFKDNHLSKTENWVKLPTELGAPKLALIHGGKTLLVFSSANGIGYSIDTMTRVISPVKLARGLDFIGDEGENLVGHKKDGGLFWIDPNSFKAKEKFAIEPQGALPGVTNGLVAFETLKHEGQVWTPQGVLKLTREPYPSDPTIFSFGSFDSSGRPALFEFRQSGDYHKGGLILKRRAQLAGDSLRDIPFESSEAYWVSSGNDGILDGWKLKGFRGLDLKALGCTPNHADVICLISRFDDVDKTRVENDIKRVIKFYADLKTSNPDGTTGIRFHPIFLDTIKGNDMGHPWWQNRDKFLPEKWRGVVHWMQITNGGGGQANELADGGTCGLGALWAVFVHEFGHQLGLNHEGFLSGAASPMYTSLMNYTWSYGFEDTRDKIHYSDGRFAQFALHEDDLDETLPFPYEKVKFLSMSPYHYHLKPAGNVTLIDWNWNGVFGEKHVKANINYAYSISAGERDNLGKTKTAPWIFTHQNHAFVIYGTNDLPVDLKVQPTITAARPGRLILKEMNKPNSWGKEWLLESGGLIGDPVATSFGKSIICFYQTSAGLQLKKVELTKDGPVSTSPETLNSDPTLVPTIGVYNRACYLFDWNPKNQEVGYRILNADGKVTDRFKLDVSSANPVGLCVDTHTQQAVIGMAQDQSNGRNNRWQIRHFLANTDGHLVQQGGPDWVDGEKGGSRGTGRITVLFDSTKDAGPNGRVLFYCKGMTDEKTPWACSYVAQQIADKSFNGGWIVKRYYDEWSQTRSAPAAAWFNGDVMFAYRWTAGDQSQSDNDFHLGYHGLGIAPGDMGDFDDLSYIRNFGLANSILNLSPTP